MATSKDNKTGNQKFRTDRFTSKPGDFEIVKPAPKKTTKRKGAKK